MTERAALTERQRIAEVLFTIRWVQKHLKLARWPVTRYGHLYGKRSVEQILRDGTTNYMNPCLDLTMVLLHRLKEKGYSPTLVLQELIGEHTGKPTLHFALEIPIGEKRFTVDFPRSKTANFYEGEYNHMNSYPHLLPLALHRVPTNAFTAKTKPSLLLGMRRLRDAGKRFQHVRHADIQRAFKMMRKADSPDLHRIVSERPLRVNWKKIRRGR